MAPSLSTLRAGLDDRKEPGNRVPEHAKVSECGGGGRVACRTGEQHLLRQLLTPPSSGSAGQTFRSRVIRRGTLSCSH